MGKRQRKLSKTIVKNKRYKTSKNNIKSGRINGPCVLSLQIPRTGSLTSKNCVTLVDFLGQKCYNQKVFKPLEYLDLVHKYCVTLGHEDWACSYGSHLPLFGETFTTSLTLEYLLEKLHYVQEKVALENKVYVESNLLSAICRKYMEHFRYGEAWETCAHARKLFPYMEPCRWSADVLLTEAGMLYKFEKLFQRRVSSKCYKREAFSLVSRARQHCLQDSERGLYLKYDAMDYFLLMIYLQIKISTTTCVFQGNTSPTRRRKHLKKVSQMLSIAREEVKTWGCPSKGNSRRHRNTVGNLKKLNYLILCEQAISGLNNGDLSCNLLAIYRRAVNCFSGLKTKTFSMFFVEEDLKTKHDQLLANFGKQEMLQRVRSQDTMTGTVVEVSSSSGQSGNRCVCIVSLSDLDDRGNHPGSESGESFI